MSKLYFVSDSDGILTCLDASTGKEHYRERLGGNHYSSPILADGKIYLASRESVASVIKPGVTFEILSQNPLPGKFMASPAAVDTAVYLRTDTAVHRIEKAGTALQRKQPVPGISRPRPTSRKIYQGDRRNTEQANSVVHKTI